MYYNSIEVYVAKQIVKNFFGEMEMWWLTK